MFLVAECCRYEGLWAEGPRPHSGQMSEWEDELEKVEKVLRREIVNGLKSKEHKSCT